jgi:hypothetical protein
MTEKTDLSTARQEGKWIVLLWGGGIVSAIICTLLTLNYNAQQNMSKDISSMRTDFQSFIAGDEEKKRSITEKLEDHEVRIRDLERVNHAYKTP